MSFDLFFQPCRFSGGTVEKTNPFNGEIESIPFNESLSATELRAVERVLKEAGADSPAEDGCYVVKVGDGGEAEVWASNLGSSCMVALRGITPNLMQFLFDLLIAGNWVMLPAMEDTVAITTSPQSLKGVPTDFPSVVVCKSANELAVLLTEGVRQWEKYRDQVTGRDG
jgi:hypothetical protein